MMVGLMGYIMAMKNAFSTKVSVSTTMSPATTVDGQQPLDAPKLTLPFGAHIHLNVDTNNPTSTMKQRTVPSICHGTSGNTQGTYRFMSLHTGRKLRGRTWKRLQILSNAIETVHNLGHKQHMHNMPNGPVFEWRPHIPLLPQVVNMMMLTMMMPVFPNM